MAREVSHGITVRSRADWKGANYQMVLDTVIDTSFMIRRVVCSMFPIRPHGNWDAGSPFVISVSRPNSFCGDTGIASKTYLQSEIHFTSQMPLLSMPSWVACHP